MARIASEPRKDRHRTPLAEEIHAASRLHREAKQVVKDLLNGVRMGKQVSVEQLDPLVERMVQSIFRNPDALLPLGRLKDHDHYTFQHSVSVCILLAAFARQLDMDQDRIRQIAIGGLLHDVGKAGVSEAILNKPAKLTDAEFLKMKAHAAQGSLILQNTPGITPISLDVAGQHHERFDGSGYPHGLKGEEISVYGRMAAIVDVCDAITSNRVYHKGMAPTLAMGRLIEWSTHHFDPTLVRLFVKCLGIYPSGSLVRLASGRLAIVREQHPEKIMQPRVQVMFHAVHKRYLPPEMLDLARSQEKERIVGCEEFSAWGIDPARWIAG